MSEVMAMLVWSGARQWLRKTVLSAAKCLSKSMLCLWPTLSGHYINVYLLTGCAIFISVCIYEKQLWMHFILEIIFN